MDTPKKHNAIIEENFGSQAVAYLGSATHATGDDLKVLVELLQKHPDTTLLDMGCGGGHVSYTAAPYVRQVTAYDMSTRMLHIVEQEAARRALGNIEVRQGLAESLPFADASFNIVVSRYSAHHWHDVGQAVREAARVLKTGGLLVIIDVVAPGLPMLDIYLQTVEMLRDTSHVRDYAPAEWLAFLAAAGFGVQRMLPLRLHLEYTPWVTRIRTPEPLASAIRELQKTASQEVRSYFAIEADGSFSVDIMMLQSVKGLPPSA